MSFESDAAPLQKELRPLFRPVEPAAGVEGQHRDVPHERLAGRHRGQESRRHGRDRVGIGTGDVEAAAPRCRCHRGDPHSQQQSTTFLTFLHSITSTVTLSLGTVSQTLFLRNFAQRARTPKRAASPFQFRGRSFRGQHRPAAVGMTPQAVHGAGLTMGRIALRLGSKRAASPFQSHDRSSPDAD